MTGPRAFIAIPALVLALVVPLALPLASGAGAPDRWWGPGEGRTWPSTLDYRQRPRHAAGAAGGRADGDEGPSLLRTAGQATAAPASPATSPPTRWAWRPPPRARAGRPRAARTRCSPPMAPTVPTCRSRNARSHSLLLDHGLIRIQRDWPPRTAGWQAHHARLHARGGARSHRLQQRHRMDRRPRTLRCRCTGACARWRT